MLSVTLSASARSIEKREYHPSPGGYNPEVLTNPHVKWLQERIQEARSVKVGMSYADLLKVYQMEGGAQFLPPDGGPPDRYVLKTCPFIQVRVEFKMPPNIEPKFVNDQDIKIAKISELILEYPAMD